ncbi:hypothetical protein [Coleofasciculus sp. H7-2]|uniref:hypothetical protein n=1 Tax=Coleofasciculus sp. H7-2 TaxID=3351545 RepID=UPI0036700E63
MTTYNDVLIQVQSLTPDEQLRLLEYLTALIRPQIISEKQRSLEVGNNSSLSPELRRKKIVEILEKLAASNVFSEVSDPVRWQQELRQDRPLPDRDR